MRNRIKRWLTTAIALASFASFASAQTYIDTSNASLPADKMLHDMLQPTTQPDVPAIVHPDIETVYPQGHPDTPAAPGPIREGSEIVNRAGWLRKVDGSPYPEFVFDNSSDSAPLSPMSVLPDLRRMQMENAMAATSADLKFTVSGTLTEYGGKNYILLETEPNELSQQLFVAPPRQPTTSLAPADQMLNAMLSSDVPSSGSSAPIPHTPEIDSTSGSGAVHPNAPVLTVMKEGSEIIDRTGRMTRAADGQQAEFTFDADGMALRDPPLIILPNLKLTTMENAITNSFRDLRFRVTGTITEYRGRNCILLEKVVVVPDAVQQF